MSVLLKSIFLSAILFISQTSQANELNMDSTQKVGPYTVHYSVFNSLFILPDIAKVHGLVRAKDRALINITVQDSQTGKALAVNLNVYATNLMQQQKKLNFKEIKEPNAIYYIADLRTGKEEIYHFLVEFQEKGKAKQSIKFTRKLYAEN